MPKTAELLYGAIFFFVNVVFVLRYGGRASVHPAVGALGYLVFLALQFMLGAVIVRWVSRQRRAWFWPAAVLAVYLLATLSIYLRLDPQNLQVDRWSALDHFLAALFRGEFPYLQRTHLDHSISGFPGLFLLAVPFYALGDVGYLQFAALIAFTVLMFIRFRDSGRTMYLLAMLLAMPVFEYQVFCRSDLFGNMVAVAWLLHLGSRPGAARGGRLWLWAVAWGLMLSTRAIVFIPLILASGPLLNGRGWKASGIFFMIAGAVFAATFAPFYLWNPALFLAHNPYDVQSGYVSRWVLLAILAACLGLAYRHRAAPRMFLHTGTLLFSTIFVCWVLKALDKGWDAVLWRSEFDISYFILGVPFLLLALGESPSPFSSNHPAGAKARP